jgi:hypothetical protein
MPGYFVFVRFFLGYTESFPYDRVVRLEDREISEPDVADWCRSVELAGGQYAVITLPGRTLCLATEFSSAMRPGDRALSDRRAARTLFNVLCRQPTARVTVSESLAVLISNREVPTTWYCPNMALQITAPSSGLLLC